MTSMKTIEEFLGLKRIAVVGVSHQQKDFSRVLYRDLIQRGYDAVPVNPGAAEIEGQRCFARVQDVAPPVEGALLMTSPRATDGVVRDCAAAGVKRIWMFRGAGKGAVSPDAVSFCKANNMSVIPGECPFMFLPGTFIHCFHGLVRKMAGSYPR